MASSNPSRFPSKLRQTVRGALGRWARARARSDQPPITLRPRRIYILPTRAGVATGVLLLVMLLGGLNYNNSLVLMLCFLLSGVALVSMHECHRMLAGLTLLRAEASSTFAHRLGQLQLLLTNEDVRMRRALTLNTDGCEAVVFNLAPQASELISLHYRAQGRGLQRIERIELSCRAPLLLFRAWTWLYPPLPVVVYPTPAGMQALPPPQGAPRAGEPRQHVSGEEEWAWLRPFRAGDPPRSVAWKAYARGAPLLVAHYDAPAASYRVLELHAVRAPMTEAKLSQLAQWVLDCEHLGERYALTLPGKSVPPGHGLAQKRAALEALALYEQ